jgi:hypothetical protein
LSWFLAVPGSSLVMSTLPYCSWQSELARIRPPLAHFQYKNRSYSYRIQCSQNLGNAKGLSPVFRADNLYHPNLCRYSCFVTTINLEIIWK